MPNRFRIDKFAVPRAHRDTFLAAVEATHAVLRLQSGFVRDLVAVQTGGPGRFDVVTLAEWTPEADLEAIAAKVRAAQAARGFDAAARLAEWGVEADLGWYRAA